jgi:nitroimidazol reductase NimA-like FMN-containing flavoprotein (pyridoxamine 5'-phosphate oxidase superfamily)
MGSEENLMDETWSEVLDLDACMERLRSHSVGRIAVVADGFPIVLPVNYRLLETVGLTWVVLRTRTGNVIDTASDRVAFEIDGIDVVRERGWSVLVRGTLEHVDPEAAEFRERFDPQPWLDDERDAWLMIEPFAITGRELRSAEGLWAFDTHAYL